MRGGADGAPVSTRDRSITVRRKVPATPTSIFEVLADGWAYADWVVGAKRIRRVDDSWPALGSTFGHEVGAGPATTSDRSMVVTVDPPQRLVLDVGFRPAGTARVDIRLDRVDDGATVVTLVETLRSGPIVHWRTLLWPVFMVRNAWSLRRLERLARHRGGSPLSLDP